jgi:hypothetical protein
MKSSLLRRQNITAVLIVAIVLLFAYIGHLSSGTLAGTMLVFAIVGAYFFPTIVAAARKVPNQGSVFVINLFLGWTLIGWIVALAMAARSRIVPVVEESLTR